MEVSTTTRTATYIRTSSGVGLFHRDWGDGPPVVFVASWSLPSDSWATRCEPRRVCRRRVDLSATRPRAYRPAWHSSWLQPRLAGRGRWFEQAAVVKPVDPLQRGELDGLQAPPRSAAVDHLGLVKAVDRFGQGVVIAVADAAHRRLDASLRQALGILYGHVLTPSVRLMNEPAAGRSPLVQPLLERVQHEAGVGRTAHPPADDAPGERVDVRRTSRFDDEGHVDEARPGTHVGEIGDSKHVRGWHTELAVDAVERARRRLVAHRGPHRLAADDASKPHIAHQPRHRAAGNKDALSPQTGATPCARHKRGGSPQTIAGPPGADRHRT